MNYKGNLCFLAAFLAVCEGSGMNAVNSKISEVTVFTDRAQVMRTADVKVAKGEQTFLFDRLPEAVEPNSIRVDGTCPLILRDVRLKTEHFADVPDKEKKSLLDLKLKLEETLKEAGSRIDRANREIAFVEGIAGKLTGRTEESKAFELDPEKWTKMIALYRTKLDDLGKEIQAVEKSVRDTQNELDKVSRQLEDLGGLEDRTKNVVEVVVEAKSEGNAVLKLSYIVYGPSWRPMYDLRVSSDAKKMGLAYHGLVQQSTAEDWEGVKMRLSTARPQVGGKQPELQPWRVDFFQPAPSPVRAAKMAPQMRNEPMSQMFSSEVAAVTAVSPEEDEFRAMERPEAQVETGATAVVFAVSGTADIKSDNQPHKVTVMMKDFDAYFRYSTVPKLAQYAYLKARVRNQTEYPVLPGEANIFFDNNFVAVSALKLVAPGEEFWTSLGIDEGVKVEYKFLKKYQKDEGVFGKRTKVFYEYLILVTNNKKTPEELTVWDQIPISGHQDIQVALIEPKYEKDTDVLKKNDVNFLEWLYQIKPGEKTTIPFKFSVEYPRNGSISGLE